LHNLFVGRKINTSVSKSHERSSTMMIRQLQLKGMGISQFFQLSFNVALAKVMPWYFLRIYMYLIGFLYLLFNKGDRKKISLCVNYVVFNFLVQSYIQSFYYVLKAYLGIFDHYYEKLILAHRSLSETSNFLNSSLHIVNRHILDELQKKGKGALLVTGHYGSVEFLPLALLLQGYRVSMICKFKTPELKKAILEKAKNFDVEVIDASEGNVAFKAVNAIKNGRILVTECDEFKQWRRDKKGKVQVFGSAVSRDKTLDFFYRRTKAPVILVLMRRDSYSRITMLLEQVADGKEKVAVGAKAWKMLERHILAFPYQWYQWKEAAVELSKYINLENWRENKTVQGIPAQPSVLTSDFT